MVKVAAAMKAHLPTKKRLNDYASKGTTVVTRLSDDNKVGALHTVSATSFLVCK